LVTDLTEGLVIAPRVLRHPRLARETIKAEQRDEDSRQ
jgi:hypothetical protein